MTTPRSEQLKPCPFCSGNPTFYENEYASETYVYCDRCNFRMEPRLWNRRAPLPPVPESGEIEKWAENEKIKAWAKEGKGSTDYDAGWLGHKIAGNYVTRQEYDELKAENAALKRGAEGLIEAGNGLCKTLARYHALSEGHSVGKCEGCGTIDHFVHVLADFMRSHPSQAELKDKEGR